MDQPDNGAVVLKTLERMGKPVTAKQVADYLSEATQVAASRLMATVVSALEGGRSHGFVKFQSGKYYLAAIDPFSFPPPDRVVQYFRSELTVKKAAKPRRYKRRLQRRKVTKRRPKTARQLRRGRLARRRRRRSAALRSPKSFHRERRGRSQGVTLPKRRKRSHWPRRRGRARGARVRRLVRFRKSMRPKRKFGKSH